MPGRLTFPAPNWVRRPAKLLREQPLVRQREGEILPKPLEELVHRILEGAAGVQWWHSTTTGGLRAGILFVDRFSGGRDNGYCKCPSSAFALWLFGSVRQQGSYVTRCITKVDCLNAAN